MWDPRSYLRYGDERSRPFHDLLARVAGRPAARGGRPRLRAGHADRDLGRRWPAARVAGLDSSPEMIDRRRARRPGRLHRRRRHTTGTRPPTWTCWSPTPCCSGCRSTRPAAPLGRRAAARRLARLPGPGNFAAPSHRALREVAAAAAGGHCPAAAARGARSTTRPGTPRADRAGCAGRRLGDHLPAPAARPRRREHPVLRWLDGTALRPVRAVLDDTGWASSAPRWECCWPARTRYGRDRCTSRSVGSSWSPAPVPVQRRSSDRPVRLHRRTAQGGAARAPRRLRLPADRRRAGRPARGTQSRCRPTRRRSPTTSPSATSPTSSRSTSASST